MSMFLGTHQQTVRAPDSGQLENGHKSTIGHTDTFMFFHVVSQSMLQRRHLLRVSL